MTKQAHAAIWQPNAILSIAPSNAPSIAHQIGKSLRILCMKQLKERTQLSRATLYVLMLMIPLSRARSS